MAMKVAKEKSKQWILTNYLNTIYLGQGAYGIEAAAETYYGKPSAKLTVAQDAVIAAIIQQPSTYPLQRYRHPARGPLALRAQRHGADGDADRAEGRGDEVPGARQPRPADPRP